MRHVHHQKGADLLGYLIKRIKINDAGICTGARHNHFGPVLPGQCFDHLIIDGAGLLLDTIVDKIVELPRKADFGTVGQMAAVGQVHPQDGISRLE